MIQNETTTSHFSVQARNLESASKPVPILRKMLKDLDNCVPSPTTKDVAFILTSMEKYAARPMVQMTAFQVLTELSTNEQTVGSISTARGATAVIKAMRTHPDHANINELGCTLLMAIALNDRTLVKEAGGIQVLSKAMEHFPEHAAIQLSSCRAISACFGTQDDAKSIDALDVIEPLLKAMEAYPNHAELQDMCCEALGSVSMSHDGALSILKRGGISLVISAMERNAHWASTQVLACRTLYHVLLLPQTQEICNSISVAEVVTCILSALQLHTDHELVQQLGYEALSILVHDGGSPNQSICDLMTTEHDFVDILNNMKKYIGNVRLQFSCLRVVMALMISDLKMARSIANAGILKLTLEALREHPDNAVLQSEGLFALRAFVKYSDRLRDRVVSEGAIDFAMNTMWRHERCAPVQRMGCKLFNIICRDPLNCALIIAAGGIECVSNAMKLHENEVVIQEDGAKFLSLTQSMGVSKIVVGAAAA